VSVQATDRLPRELALVVERDTRGHAVDPGWRLAAARAESHRAAGAIEDGAWRPVEDGGVEVRLGDAFSGILLRLRTSHDGFAGEAQTYQDVGDASWRAPAELERAACVENPKASIRKEQGMRSDLSSRTYRTVGLAVLLSTVPVAAFASESPGQPTIRVVARGAVTVKPDRAEIVLGVMTDKETATAAVAENARKMGRVLVVLKKEFGGTGEIKTSEISVHPRFDESRDGTVNRHHIHGYTAINTLRISLPDTRVVGPLLDSAFQAGANTIEDVEFTLKDRESAQNQALHDASAKARSRATAMAEGQGMRVGDVISVSEGERDSPFSEFQDKALYKYANIMPMPLEPGSIQVSATVTVVFALKAR
jgi:uncharacterized protein YggE